jgi:2-phosphosulfolactate phosphatase
VIGLPIVDAVALPDLCAKTEFEGKAAVVIDVLRASTTIVAALDAGSAGVVARQSVESARQYALSHPGVLLGGERSAMRVEGFDLGNSPLEYTRAVVDGRVVVLSTTNGTRAIELSLPATSVMVGSLTNRASVANSLKTAQRDVLLVCSGTDGQVSEEDCFGAGLIAALLDGWGELTTRARIMLDDSYSALSEHGDIASVLFQTFHGDRISKLGLDADIHAAAKLDTSNCVPILNESGMLVPAR